jgi:hypothetical protein
MKAAEARRKHPGRPPVAPCIEIKTLAASSDLSIRQIQKEIAGKASRSVVGKITKRIRAGLPPPCDHLTRISNLPQPRLPEVADKDPRRGS